MRNPAAEKTKGIKVRATRDRPRKVLQVIKKPTKAVLKTQIREATPVVSSRSPAVHGDSTGECGSPRRSTRIIARKERGVTFDAIALLNDLESKEGSPVKRVVKRVRPSNSKLSICDVEFMDLDEPVPEIKRNSQHLDLGGECCPDSSGASDTSSIHVTPKRKKFNPRSPNSSNSKLSVPTSMILETFVKNLTMPFQDCTESGFAEGTNDENDDYIDSIPDSPETENDSARM